MLGQFILTGISGLELTEEEKKFLKEKQPVGVILFTRNYENPAQLRELVADIQSCAKDEPFLIGADQEGGRVQRFKEGFTRIPAMLDLVKEGSPKKVFETHQLMAEELLRCGVNLNFSPVCDILSNEANQVIGDRAFGREPEEVDKYISAAIRGLRTQKVISCAKHFPGHGRSKKDSHLEKVIVPLTQEELDWEMTPFRRAVRSRVPMMMPSHMIVDYFDTELPCSMSKKALDYIRKELDFRGVIISDDFNMNAIKNEFSIPEASIIAVEAGCDIICFRDMPLAIEALEALEKHSISETRLQESADRIKALKAEYLDTYSVPSAESFIKN